MILILTVCVYWLHRIYILSADNMRNKKIFNHNVLKINDDESLSFNKRKFNMILRIIRDDQEQYSIVKEKLQISEKDINKCIKEYHDESLQEHFEMTKIMQFLWQHCQFSHMRQKIEIYIKKCLNCQRNKHTTHAEYDEIQYVKSSIKVWDEITLNFIIKLSKSQNSVTDQHYDAIFMIIDRFTKYAHLISFCENYEIKQLKYVILNRLIRYHEIFKELTSDRNKLFTFKYWQTFISMLETRLHFFTAYHSRTNEQTKQINQTLKQYLCYYVNYHQDNWVKLLSITQIAMNNEVSNTIKISSYFANFDKESNLFEQKLKHVAADLIMNRVKRFKNIKNNIQKM